MNINSLSGLELDKYGESLGIPRYQGLGRPESDEAYRESIRSNAKGTISSHEIASKHDVCISVTNQIFHTEQNPLYGVLVIDYNDGSVVRIAADYNRDNMAIYTSKSEAQTAADKWLSVNRTYKFEVREIKIFEG